MTTYKSIVGQKIQKVSSDPPAAAGGQIWYNTTKGTLRGVPILEAFSSGGNLITGRQGVGGAGTQDAGLAISGRTYPSPYVTNTEEYDGSGWATGGAVSTARIYAATSKNGTQTACFIASGTTPSPPVTSTTEEYNGTSWSSGGAVNTARGNSIGFGTLTAGVMCGGSADTDATEEYDGSSWTTVNNLGTARVAHGGSGIITAGLIFGGNNPSPAVIATTEEYDGTNWTAGGDLNTGRAYVTGFGIQSNSIANGGGYPSASNTIKTEGYNGTSWSNKPNSSNTRWASDSGWGASGSAGGVSGALSNSLDNVSATEEFNRSANVITAAAWASGGSLPAATRLLGGGGTQTDFIAAAGFPAKTEAYIYNGSSWSGIPDISTGRYGVGGAGTSTAGLIYGGYITTAQTITEEYSGSSWSGGGALNNATYSAAAFGTLQTAAVTSGGLPSGSGPSVTNKTEEYNGTAWSNGNNAPINHQNSGGAGTESSGIVCFGKGGPSDANFGTTLLYDGTNWTTGATGNQARQGAMGAGASQTSAIFFGGNLNPPLVGSTEEYNGTSWSTRATMAKAREGFSRGNSGTSTAAIGVGGEDSTGTIADSEEFTGETTAVNVKTLSTS